jgi:disulfide bond formation protein DsbB
MITKRYLYSAVCIIAFVATCGSLYYSLIQGLIPCDLCWYQRILMYPITLLAATALIARTKDLAIYVLPLSMLGIILSGYQYALQKFIPVGAVPITCSANGVGCATVPFQYAGFITIPFMSFSAFVMITALLLWSLRLDKTTPL